MTTSVSSATQHRLEVFRGTALGTASNPVDESSAAQFFRLPRREWLGRHLLQGHLSAWDGVRRLPVAPPRTHWEIVDRRSGTWEIPGELTTYQLVPGASRESNPWPTVVSEQTGITYTSRRVDRLAKSDLAKLARRVDDLLSSARGLALPRGGKGLTFNLRPSSYELCDEFGDFEGYEDYVRVDTEFLDSAALGRLQKKISSDPSLRALLGNDCDGVDVGLPW